MSDKADAKVDAQDSKMNVFELKGTREMITAERAAELVKPLLELIEKKEFSHYKKVNLSGHSFGKEAATIFADALAKLNGVEFVDFSDIIAGRKEEEAVQVLKILCDSLEKHAVKELNLSDNALGQKGVQACEKALVNQTVLTKLLINNNGLQADAISDIAKFLISNHKDGKTKLEHLEVFNNLLQDAGAIALAVLIEHSPALRHFRISTTRVSRAGGLAVVKALSHARQLRHLDLSDNTFGLDAGLELAKSVLDSQPELTTLILSDIGFEEEGNTAILEALAKTAPLLQVLDLSSNELNPEHAELLVRAVDGKAHLRSLNLDGNEIGSSGAESIAEGLRDHKEIASINFARNQITTSALRSIVKYLVPMSTLRFLDINGNELSKKGVKLIRSSLAAKEECVLGSLSENEEEEEAEEEENEEEDLAPALDALSTK